MAPGDDGLCQAVIVFILLIRQRCVIRCKIKMKSCQELMRCGFGDALPLLCISIAAIYVFFLFIVYFLLKPSLAGHWKGYASAACTSSCLAFHALKHNNLYIYFPLQQFLKSQLWFKMFWFLSWCYYKFLEMQTY